MNLMTSADSPAACSSRSLRVLDLFTGLGGLALGFRAAGFEVTGVDRETVSGDIYQLNAIGEFVEADLFTELVERHVPVIVGGPPCRPWSVVNQQRRNQQHPEHGLVSRFFEHVRALRPEVFLMENVVALRSADTYRHEVSAIRAAGYAVRSLVVNYADYGAPMTRRRLFTVGVRRSQTGVDEFFADLEKNKTDGPKTVRDAIAWTRDLPRNGHADHDWSNLTTIHKYTERYSSGKYGWAQLAYDKPAPSFGSIAKTYILHPEAGIGDFPARVLSVREAMSLMGLEPEFRFPEGTSRAKRYHMVANAISPIVGQVSARIIGSMIHAGSGISDASRDAVQSGPVS